MPDDLTIGSRDGLGIASVMARRGIGAGAIGAALGIDMPTRPLARFAGSRTAIGTGPGTWLLIDEQAAPDFAETLAERLTGLASVSDQSGAYGIWRLSGPAARIVLRRGATIDLDPPAFSPGSAATTVIAHIGVILWQVDERPAYDMAVFRSYTASFRGWLERRAAALPA